MKVRLCALSLCLCLCFASEARTQQWYARPAQQSPCGYIGCRSFDGQCPALSDDARIAETECPGGRCPIYQRWYYDGQEDRQRGRERYWSYRYEPDDYYTTEGTKSWPYVVVNRVDQLILFQMENSSHREDERASTCSRRSFRCGEFRDKRRSR